MVMKFVAVFSSCIILAASISAAQTINSQDQAEIRQSAIAICGEYQTDGSGTTSSVNGKVNAQVKGLLEKLGDLELSGDGTVVQDDYSGVFRKELGEELRDIRECRKLVFLELTSFIKLLYERKDTRLTPKQESYADDILFRCKADPIIQPKMVTANFQPSNQDLAFASWVQNNPLAEAEIGDVYVGQSRSIYRLSQRGAHVPWIIQTQDVSDEEKTANKLINPSSLPRLGLLGSITRKRGELNGNRGAISIYSVLYLSNTNALVLHVAFSIVNKNFDRDQIDFEVKIASCSGS